MTQPTDPQPPAVPLPTALSAAWLGDSHDLLALTDGAGRIGWSNAAFQRATGIGAQGNLLSLAPGDGLAGASREALLAALRSGTPSESELGLRAVSGATLWVHARVSRVGDDRLWTLLDVTDKAEHSRRAEHLAQRLEGAARAGRMGIWTSSSGPGGSEWNAQMHELFDRVGQAPPHSLAEALRHCVHPDDAARVERAVRDYLRADPGAFEIEFRSRRRDGGVRWIVLRADVDRSFTEGRRLFGVALDVTDRHEALAALHRASERAALIARHAGIGTWETDENGTPALWDEQMFRLRGMAPRERAPAREERLAIVHPDDHARLIDADPRLSATTQPMAYEFRVRLPDGSYRWLASRSAALRNEHGQVVRRVGVNWDITESKSADLARQQALLAERESQAKSRFLSRMSHELRTPLNAVLGFTQLLQVEARRAPASGQSAKLDRIRAAGEHLLTLINDTLDLSSLEAGTLKLDLQPVPLAQAVAQAVPLVADLAGTRGIAMHAGRLEGTANADPMRLRQVLLNLLTNAIKYNRSGGQVSIESVADGDDMRLRVRDTGRGMRPEQLAHLYEPFNRLGMENEGIEGSGIGLTIVKALVEGMGGRIQATSQPGTGTLFEVSLPAATQARPDAPPRAAPPGGGAPSPRLRWERAGQLLYIEDNSVNVLLVEELVKSLSGLRIVSETTGAAGVARARSLRPNVILVDMQLPDFDGFEVLRRLRAAPETAAIPCIALSANAMPEDIARGLAGGFDDYWTKPIKFKPFLDALERLFPIDPGAA